MMTKGTTLGKGFLNFFSVPRFLSMPAVGIDISDFTVKFLELTKRKGEIKVGRFGEEKIPEGAVVSGTINDREKLVETLKSLRKKHNFTFARASLPEEKAFLFKTEIPNGTEEEMRTAIEFKLEENVPMSPEKAAFDFDILPSTKGGTDVSAVVSVFPEEDALRYIDMLGEAGFMVLSLEIEAQAIARSVIRKGDRGTHMIVDFGRNRSGISVVSDGVVHFTTTVDIGGDLMTQAIRKNHPEADESEIEAIKNKKGLVKGEDDDGTFDSMISTISALRDEMNKHYVYWHTHKDKNGKVGKKIEKIILTGGNANVAGLPEHLANTMKVRVERANVWTNVFGESSHVPEIDFEHSFGFSSSVGLALHEEK